MPERGGQVKVCRKHGNAFSNCRNARRSTPGTRPGCAGRASNDILVKDVFVPGERTFSFQDPSLIKRPGPLYAFPFLFIGKVGAPALGIARQALDALIGSAAEKPARRYTLGERVESTQGYNATTCSFRMRSVCAETLLASVRAYQFDVMGDLWTTLGGWRPAIGRANGAV